MNKIKNEVKAYITKSGHTMTQLADLLNEKYNKKTAVQYISNKLTRESISYKEILEIADVLGYEIIWKEKSSQ